MAHFRLCAFDYVSQLAFLSPPTAFSSPRARSRGKGNARSAGGESVVGGTEEQLSGLSFVILGETVFLLDNCPGVNVDLLAANSSLFLKRVDISLYQWRVAV